MQSSFTYNAAGVYLGQFNVYNKIMYIPGVTEFSKNLFHC